MTAITDDMVDRAYRAFQGWPHDTPLHPAQRRDRTWLSMRDALTAVLASPVPAASSAGEDLCTGCGVRPGQTHWDNCPHHPAFSQPVYHGGGR